MIPRHASTLTLPVLTLALLTLALPACSPPPEGQDRLDATAEDVVLPDCKQAATLYAIAADESHVDLTTGAALAITRGFQGFLFVRVGLRAPFPLPTTVKLKVHIAVQDGTDVASQFSTVHSHATGDGSFVTTDVAFFFNDMPLAAMVGRTAHVQVTAKTADCVVQAAADVTLTVGDFMAQDAGFWDSSDTSP